MTRSFSRSFFAAAVAVLVVASSPAAAQGRWVAGRPDVRNRGDLPRGQRPPYGLCRIWVDGVAPGLQSNATGCAYAYSNVPRNGRVIYGGERGELFGNRYDPYYYKRQTRERDRGDYRYRDDEQYRGDRYRDDNRYQDDHRYRDDDDYCDDDGYRQDDRYRDDRYRDDDNSRYWTDRHGSGIGQYREHDREYAREQDRAQNRGHGRAYGSSYSGARNRGNSGARGGAHP